MPIATHCPIDGGTLIAHPHGEGSFYQCETCSGIWVSRMFLLGLASRPDRDVLGDLAALPSPVHRSAPIHCPGCGYLMVQRLQHDVQIDTCPDCRAVWLDGGEIAHIGRRQRGKQAKAAAKRPPRRASTTPDPDGSWLTGILETAAVLAHLVWD